MLTSVVNFRPAFHGATVPRLYRSGSISSITAEEARLLRSELDVRVCIDLRSDVEIELTEKPMNLHSAGVRWDHIPCSGEYRRLFNRLVMTLEDYVDAYIQIAWEARNSLQRLFEFLCEEEGSVLVCCSLGKDRTGVICALFGCAMGLKFEELANDYVLTQHYLFPHLDTLKEIWFPSLSREACRERFATKETVLYAFLERLLLRYRSVSNFLSQCDIKKECVETIRHYLGLRSNECTS